jgi:hypothetical protein
MEHTRIAPCPSEGILRRVPCDENKRFFIHANGFVSSSTTKADLVTLIVILQREKWDLTKEQLSS